MSDEQKQEKNGVSRRDFLTGLGYGGVAVLALQGAAVGGTFVYPKGKAMEVTAFKAGTADQFQEGVTYLDGKRVFIVREADGLRALSAVCTHLGCTVNWAADRDQFECPCHGSIFDKSTAAVKGGPAPKPLDWVSLTMLEDGTLEVDPAVPVDRSKVVKA